MKFSENFISATKEYCSFEKSVPAPYIRKSFSLSSKPKSAHISICGLGFYKLFINGKDVTKGFLAPYISNPDDIVYYDEYDITGELSKGENVIGVILGNGFQNPFGGLMWNMDKALFRSAPKLALTFDAEVGKNHIEFEADESFKCHPSPIFFDEYRAGVFYDSTKEIAGWNKAGFDDSSWKCAISVVKPAGTAMQCCAEPIVVKETFDAVSVKKGKLIADLHPRVKDRKCQYSFGSDDGYVFDFGTVHTGVPKLKIKGKKGQTVCMCFADLADKKGNANATNSACFYPEHHGQFDVFICSGKNDEYVPDFTYHAYRYVFVSGITKEQAKKEILQSLVLCSDIEKRGSFACSDDTVNAIQSCAVRSDVSNFLYFPTDCPHREKNGWTGDASLSCEHMMYNLTVEESLKEWLRNICASQRRDGAIPGIVPTTGWGFDWGNGPAWDSVLFELPYRIYKMRGDKSVITENATAMMRYLDYISKQRRPDGLLKLGLGDWLHPGRQCEGYKSPLEVTSTLFTYDSARKAAFLFKEAGLTVQAQFAETFADELRECFRKRLIDFDTMTVLGSCQTSQALALAFGMFENGEKNEAFSRLLEIVHDCGDKLDAGCLGLRHIFRVLSSFGESELAYKMITRKDWPSYGHMIENGATSLWENFALSGVPASACHHFMGDVSGWFMKYIAGIDVNPYDFSPNEINVAPNFIGSLNFAEGSYSAPGGKVYVKWQRKKDKIELNVKCTGKLFGKIILPKGWVFDDMAGDILYEQAHLDLTSCKYLLKPSNQKTIRGSRDFY